MLHGADGQHTDALLDLPDSSYIGRLQENETLSFPDGKPNSDAMILIICFPEVRDIRTEGKTCLMEGDASLTYLAAEP